MIRYKSIKYGERSFAVVTLQLLEDSVTNESRSNIVDPIFAQYKTSKALVIKIEDVYTLNEVKNGYSSFDTNFYYITGEIVESELDRHSFGGKGIHYVRTKEHGRWFLTPQMNGEHKYYLASGQPLGKYFLKDGKKYDSHGKI